MPCARPPISSLRLYPEPASDTLRAVAARVYGVGVDQVIAGNGSDELLTILMRCFVGRRDRVAYPMPTYSLYDTLVDIQGGIRAPVRLSAGLFDSGVAGGAAGGRHVSLQSRTRRRGRWYRHRPIARLARAVRGILVVDEAYIDFAIPENASAIPLIRRLPEPRRPAHLLEVVLARRTPHRARLCVDR